MVEKNEQNKNVNNKVDELQKIWLGMRDSTYLRQARNFTIAIVACIFIILWYCEVIFR